MCTGNPPLGCGVSIFKKCWLMSQFLPTRPLPLHDSLPFWTISNERNESVLLFEMDRLQGPQLLERSAG